MRFVTTTNKLISEVLIKIYQIRPNLFKGKYEYLLRTLNHKWANDDEINVASYLQGDFVWKGVNVVVKIHSNDVEKIQKWLSKDPIGSSYFGEELIKGFAWGSGYRNLGVFDFSESKGLYFQKIKMKRKAKFSLRCIASLHTLYYGNTYLNLFYEMNESSTKMIKDIDVEGIEEKNIVLSILPWNKYYLSTTRISKTSQIDSKIKNNFNDVISDIDNCTKDILKELKISNAENIVKFSEFFRDTDSKYFNFEENEQDESKLIITPRHNDHFQMFKNVKSNLELYKSNEYIRESMVTENVDAHCIKNGNEEFESFTLLYSHNYLSILFLIYKEFRSIEVLTNSVLLKRKGKLEDKYLVLNEAKERFQKLKEELGSFVKFINQNFKVNNLNPVLDECGHVETRIKSYQDIVQLRLDSLTSQIQKENINFTRKNSNFITILVIIQICLGLISLPNSFKEYVKTFFIDFILT